MKILFICKYNRFRSKVAEAFFNKLNKNPNNTSQSAGIIQHSPISKQIIENTKPFNIKLKKQFHEATPELLNRANLTIIVADGIPKNKLNKIKRFSKKLIHWKIRDFPEHNTEKVHKQIKIIKTKIKNLLKELK